MWLQPPEWHCGSSLGFQPRAARVMMMDGLVSKAGSRGTSGRDPKVGHIPLAL